MSFILDALRKSDQQRQRGAAPTLLAAQAAPVELRQPSTWTRSLLAVALIGAGILIGWWRPWQSDPAPAVTAARPPEAPRALPATTPALPELRATDTAPAAVSPPALPAPAPAAPAAAPIAAASASAPAAPAAQAAPAAVATPSVSQRTPVTQGVPAVQGATAAQAAPSAKGASTAAAAPEQAVVAMNELPASVRQELPAMQVLLHLYSPAVKKRFVTINNQTLQEGEPVAPGLVLEQITPDGMVLSYKGYRFRRGVQ